MDPALLERHGIPALALATFQDHKLASRQCHGCDPDTIFEAASLSKPVFATAVLALADAGEFDLDKPLLDYLGGKYIHVQQPWNPNSPTDELTDPRLGKLTARLVLSHRTGLPNWRFGRPLTFLREPGEWGYSGEGYMILQRALEKNATVDELVSRYVFSRLGMKTSRFVWSDALLPNVAHGHNADGSVRKQMGSAWPASAGSMLTTLNEYARFVEATLTAKPLLLKPETRKSMLTAVANTESAGLRWGLGWGLPHYEERYLFHWGSNPGYKCLVLASLDSGAGVLFFTNSEHGLKILPEVIREVFGKDLPLVKWRMLQ